MAWDKRVTKRGDGKGHDATVRTPDGKIATRRGFTSDKAADQWSEKRLFGVDTGRYRDSDGKQ